MPIQLYSPTSAAKRLDCSKITVYRMIRSGRLKAVNVSPTAEYPRWRITEEALQAYLDAAPAAVEAAAEDGAA